MSTPQTLANVRAVKDVEARIRAATAYIEAGEAKLREARRIRDQDVRALVANVGPAEAARRSGLSLSTVKTIKGRP